MLCRGLRLTPDFDFKSLAHNTPGFVGADLMSLAREAAMVAVNRVFEDVQGETVGKTVYVNIELQFIMEIHSTKADKHSAISRNYLLHNLSVTYICNSSGVMHY